MDKGVDEREDGQTVLRVSLVEGEGMLCQIAVPISPNGTLLLIEALGTLAIDLAQKLAHEDRVCHAGCGVHVIISEIAKQLHDRAPTEYARMQATVMDEVQSDENDAAKATETLLTKLKGRNHG